MYSIPGLAIMDDIAKYRVFLGQTIHVIIDRPMGSKHPRFGFTYEQNYGYVEGTMAGDGHEIDAYVLGINEPVTSYTGVCRAIVVRRDDNEHKLIVAPNRLSEADIRQQTEFVEHYYDTEIEMAPDPL